MDKTQAQALRAPFPDSAIGKLPKVNCGGCTEATKNTRRASEKHCDRHRVFECPTCKAYITNGHIHLDYVGHAAATDRLLTVDPEWTWRPFTAEEIGALPPPLRDGGLWIMLTVAGVTRPGFGDAQGKTGPNAIKECIGDAIRNAAMRFGMALDLWSKEDLSAIHEQPADDPEPPPAPSHEAQRPGDVDGGDPMSARTRGQLFALLTERGITDPETQRAGIARVIGRPIASRSELTEDEARAVIASLRSHKETPA